MHRQAIAKGRVAYEPNTLGSGTEFRVDGGAQGFQSYAEQLEPPKLRRRSPSFDDHFSQAALFWNSQSLPEKDHIVAAFRFELSKVEVPEIRQRMFPVSSPGGAHPAAVPRCVAGLFWRPAFRRMAPAYFFCKCILPSANLKLTVGTVKSSKGAPSAISPSSSRTHSCRRSATTAALSEKRTQVP